MQYLIVPQSCLLTNVVLHRQTRHQKLSAPTSIALASVSDAIERLQRESDLALRRIDELHVHYKKEIKATAESHARRESTEFGLCWIGGDVVLTKLTQNLASIAEVFIIRSAEELYIVNIYLTYTCDISCQYFIGHTTLKERA